MTVEMTLRLALLSGFAALLLVGFAMGKDSYRVSVTRRTSTEVSDRGSD